MIKLTEAAAAQLRQVLEREKRELYVRIFISGIG